MKTFFIFQTSGLYVLVSNNNGKSRSKAYGRYPALVVDVLKNIGFTEMDGITNRNNSSR